MFVAFSQKIFDHPRQKPEKGNSFLRKENFFGKKATDRRAEGCLT
jgi:hypothetical protein